MQISQNFVRLRLSVPALPLARIELLAISQPGQSLPVHQRKCHADICIRLQLFQPVTPLRTIGVRIVFNIGQLADQIARCVSTLPRHPPDPIFTALEPQRAVQHVVGQRIDVEFLGPCPHFRQVLRLFQHVRGAVGIAGFHGVLVQRAETFHRNFNRNFPVPLRLYGRAVRLIRIADDFAQRRRFIMQVLRHPVCQRTRTKIALAP